MPQPTQAPARLTGVEWRTLVGSLPTGLLLDLIVDLQSLKNRPITFKVHRWLVGVGSVDDMNLQLNRVRSPFRVAVHEDVRGAEFWEYDEYFLVRCHN